MTDLGIAFAEPLGWRSLVHRRQWATVIAFLVVRGPAGL